ncbi:hypothetical protein, partial [Streptomyces neyagawaensis]
MARSSSNQASASFRSAKSPGAGDAAARTPRRFLVLRFLVLVLVLYVFLVVLVLVLGPVFFLT